MDVVMSPSNMKLFDECPLKFHAQYIAKNIPKTSSAAMERGNKLHSLVEKAGTDGWDTITWPEYDNQEVAKTCCDFVWELRDQGWTVELELELATDGRGNMLDWWTPAPENYLRCKIDLFASRPDCDTAIIIDWKTGKPWDSGLQLDVNAIVAKTYSGKSNFVMGFAYLDLGLLKSHRRFCDISKPREEYENISSPMVATLGVIREMEKAFETNQFPPKTNRWCGRCPVHYCPLKNGVTS